MTSICHRLWHDNNSTPITSGKMCQKSTVWILNIMCTHVPALVIYLKGWKCLFYIINLLPESYVSLFYWFLYYWCINAWKITIYLISHLIVKWLSGFLRLRDNADILEAIKGAAAETKTAVDSQTKPNRDIKISRAPMWSRSMEQEAILCYCIQCFSCCLCLSCGTGTETGPAHHNRHKPIHP